MPELPEVETMVGDLNRRVRGRAILDVWSDTPFFAKMLRKIKGSKIKQIKRRAKNVLIYTNKNTLLLIHPKMTGHFILSTHSMARQVKYARVIFYLDKKLALVFSDKRRFAKILFDAADNIEKSEYMKGFGPEPLDKNLSLKEFGGIIKRQKRKIKQVLLDQKIIAGIGNIYSDDILWSAGVSPLKPASSLSSEEIKNIFYAMRTILRKSIKLRGSSIRDFKDSSGRAGRYQDVRLVYGRFGENCRRCKNKISKIKVAGRTAHLCEFCQRI